MTQQQQPTVALAASAEDTATELQPLLSLSRPATRRAATPGADSALAEGHTHPMRHTHNPIQLVEEAGGVMWAPCYLQFDLGVM
jgi:hypothetical protein